MIILFAVVYINCNAANAVAGEIYGGVGYALAEYKENKVTPPGAIGHNPFTGGYIELPGPLVKDQRFEDSSDSFDVFIGYRFNKYLAAEIGYAKTGKFKYIFKANDMEYILPMPILNIAETELRKTSIQLMPECPIGEQIKLYGLIGYSYFDIDYEFSGTNGITKNNSGYDKGILFGFGGRFLLNNDYSAKLQWSRTNADDFQVRFFGLSVERQWW